MQKNILSVILVVLVGVAIILGYFIYQQRLQKQPTQEPQQPLSPQPQQVDKYPSYASEEDVLVFPGEDASAEVGRRHLDLVRRIAKEAEVLEMDSGCTMNPVVFRIQEGEEFTVKNSDSVDHELVVNPEHVYSIPAGQTQQVKADFGKGPGIYGYACAFVPHTVGIFLVTQSL